MAAAAMAAEPLVKAVPRLALSRNLSQLSCLARVLPESWQPFDEGAKLANPV
jgi:hypothetical protein